MAAAATLTPARQQVEPPRRAGLELAPLRLGPVEVWPPVILAPMAGETGSTLRILCRRQGAGMVVTELTSSIGLFHQNRRSLEYLRWTAEESPLSAQLFGADPEMMAQAARMCCEAGADLIDINMGCWVPKVAKTGAGASLLRDLPRARAVMSAVVRASSVPVTIKTRVGWDGCVGSAVEMARVAEEVGVAAIAIHGRTAQQGFTGTADWRPIGEARATVSIPVIGNGDVRTPADAERMFRETGCHAVMIGRAALGNPWIFREVNAWLLDGVELPPPSPWERLRMAEDHARLLASQTHGHEAPTTPLPLVARTQLSHYLTGLPNAAEARRRITQIHCLGDLYQVTESLRDALRRRDEREELDPAIRTLTP